MQHEKQKEYKVSYAHYDMTKSFYNCHIFTWSRNPWGKEVYS